jgi:hypothetical protein
LCMLPPFESSGFLPPGIHASDTWQEFVSLFGSTPWRQGLLSGMKSALVALRKAKCRLVYVDGSFVTTKEEPGDFDICWDIAGVDVQLLDPILLKFDDGRQAQKAKFRGELFPADWTASASGKTYLDFFQVDKTTGEPKGIVVLDLARIWS